MIKYQHCYDVYVKIKTWCNTGKYAILYWDRTQEVRAMDYMTEMEIRVFNIIASCKEKATLHVISEGLPTEGTAQNDAMDAAEQLCQKNVLESFVEFSPMGPLIVSYSLRSGYENTDWYKQYIAR